MKRAKYILLAIAVLLIVVGIVTVIDRFRPQDNFRMSKTTVVKELKELNRLETAQFTIEKVIDAGTNGNTFNELLFGDRILLIAHGEVIAGFDLSRLENKDIQTNGDSMIVKLPSPEILITSLDSNQTRVYDRRRGLLARDDKDLETKARVAAQEAIQKAACDGGILDEASTNARKQLTALFKTLGFVTITIDIPQGSC